MFNLGMGEITVILLLALIFLGPKKLPELASGLGKLIREIRKTTADVKNEIQLDDAIRKPFEELRDAVTLHPDELKRRDKLRKELADIQRQAEAAVAAAEETIAASGSPLATDHDASGLAEGSRAAAEAGTESAAASDTPWSPAESAAPGISQAEQTLAQITPPPIVSSPSIPGAAPTGTVARLSSTPASGPVTTHTPPAPPLAAVLAKGSGPLSTAERGPAQPPGGSDFLRSLRAVPEGSKPEGKVSEGKVSEGKVSEGRVGEGKVGEGKVSEGLKLDAKPRTRAVSPSAAAPAPDSAADRGNVTQALSEADLAAITVGPPPPPPSRGPRPARQVPSSPSPSPSSPHGAQTTPPSPPPPRLPGATPPKNRNQ